MRLDKILCPVDFSEFSATAYEYARSLSRQYRAKLFVLHVAEPILSIYRGYISPPLVEEIHARQEADAREQVRALEGRFEREPVESEVIVQIGVVADSIVSFAEDRDVDLVVMGTHG